MSEAISPTPVPETLADAVTRIRNQSGCSKRSAVRLALLGAIHDGRFMPGDMLPPERRLADDLGVSLGTVQAALNELRENGRITRRRGDGTRVAAGADKMRTTWHFRLLDRQSQEPLFWQSADVGVAETSGDGPWADFLGCTSPFVRVRRKLVMGTRYHVGADLWLPAETARPLLGMNPTDLSLINLRTVFAEKLALKPVRVETDISVRIPSDTETASFALRAGAQHFQIEARVFSGDDSPLYFQRVLTACDDVTLSF